MKIEILYNGPYLKYGIHFQEKNKSTELYVEQDFRHTFHSFKRASQRGIMGDKIAVALEYGEHFYKQGYTYHVLGEHNIPDELQKDRKKLQNTVVVTAIDSNLVITCYRSKNPFKHIRHKPKTLVCYDFE